MLCAHNLTGARLASRVLGGMRASNPARFTDESPLEVGVNDSGRPRGKRAARNGPGLGLRLASSVIRAQLRLGLGLGLRLGLGLGLMVQALVSVSPVV